MASGTIIFIIKNLFRSYTEVPTFWTPIPVVAVVSTSHVLCSSSQEMVPTESCVLSFTGDGHGKHGSWLLKACFSNLLFLCFLSLLVHSPHSNTFRKEKENLALSGLDVIWKSLFCWNSSMPINSQLKCPYYFLFPHSHLNWLELLII